VIPQIGARIMEYDIGTFHPMYINPDEMGNSYPGGAFEYPAFGGYKVWPAPQDLWNNAWGGWPPPSMLDFGVYTAQVVADDGDSVVLSVESPVEIDGDAAGLKCLRTMTLYRGSSRLKVDQAFVNTTGATVNWSIWDVTQTYCEHPGQADYENFRAYFPKHSTAHAESSGCFVMRYDDTRQQAALAQLIPGGSVLPTRARGISTPRNSTTRRALSTRTTTRRCRSTCVPTRRTWRSKY
jgi:hypothetical protein